MRWDQRRDHQPDQPAVAAVGVARLTDELDSLGRGVLVVLRIGAWW